MKYDLPISQVWCLKWLGQIRLLLLYSVIFVVCSVTIQTHKVYGSDTFQAEVGEENNDADTFSAEEMVEPPISQDEPVDTLAEERKIKNLDPANFTGFAEIQILNKVTAESMDVVMSMGEELDFFDQLRIKVYKCWRAPPEQKPENKLLLEIHETKTFTKKLLFRGWMLTSNPGVSSLEHQLYDVTLLRCRNDNGL